MWLIGWIVFGYEFHSHNVPCAMLRKLFKNPSTIVPLKGVVVEENLTYE